MLVDDQAKSVEIRGDFDYFVSLHGVRCIKDYVLKFKLNSKNASVFVGHFFCFVTLF